MKTFAIFILKDGAWLQWGPGAATEKALLPELNYLTESIGVTAKIFKKV